MNNLTFKVQLTPTQSERFQKEVFDKGRTWAEGETTVLDPTQPFMVLRQGRMHTSSEYDERYFRSYSAPEVLTEQAFSLLENANRLRTDDNKQADEPPDQEKFQSGLATFLKRLDRIHDTILEMESKSSNQKEIKWRNINQKGED